MSLTSHLKSSQSPVRRFFDEHLGNTKGVLAAYRSGAGPLLVPNGDANPGSIGTATDWLFRFAVCPHPDLHLAIVGARRLGVKAMVALLDLADLLGCVVLADGFGPEMVTPRQDAELERVVMSRLARDLSTPLPSLAFDGPTTGSQVEADLLEPACWALGLLTELGRQGPIGLTRGPLAAYAPIRNGDRVTELPDVTMADFLAIAPPAAVKELRALRRVIEDQIVPTVASRAGDWYLGPTFAGSGAVGGADADLIAAGLLVELKTSIGKELAAGRVCSMDKADLYQLVGYALLDFDDRYGIDTVALCNGRYGHLATWPLAELVTELSSGELHLPTVRSMLAAAVGVPG